MQRVVTPELLDSDAGSPAEVAASLLDLRDLNRFLGGISLTATLFERVAQARQLSALSVLDVAGGEGYLLARVIRHLARKQISVTGTILDRAHTHMQPTAYSLTAVRGDALALPFQDESFDVVTCNLFLHHLDPAEAQQFFREAARVARYAVVANDLERNWIHWRLAQLGGLIYRSRITRNDAPASVRRAYTEQEMHDLLKPLGFRFEVIQSFFFRLGVCVWKG